MIQRIGMGIVAIFGLIFVFVAIRNTERDQADRATVPQAASAVPAAAPEPTRQPAPHQTFSVATFTKSGDVLDECAELTFWTDRPMDRKKFQAFMKSKGTTLNQGCEEAFPDRPVFASCATSVDTGDAGIPLDIVSRYYDAVTLDNNDTYMKGCLQSGGNWKAMAHDDPEYTRARLRGRVKEVVRAAEQIRQAAP